MHGLLEYSQGGLTIFIRLSDFREHELEHPEREFGDTGGVR